MNLRLRPVYFDSLITECLNIESIEYCYFIPLLAETAEYWGDANLISTCNIMSRQVKQYFNYAAHIHLYMSKKNKELKKNYFFKESYFHIHKNMNMRTKHQDFQYCKSEHASLELPKNIVKTMHFQDSAIKSYINQEGKSLGSFARQIDKNNCEMLENIRVNLDKKNNLKISEKAKLLLYNTNSVHYNDCLRLLKTLQYHKLWKANSWYPLLTKIAYDHKMVHVSDDFLQMSKSEKKMSKSLSKLIQKQYC